MKSRLKDQPSQPMRAALLDATFARISKHEDTPEQSLRRAKANPDKTAMQAALLRAIKR